ncbi:MAG: hypothetical protein ACRD2I_18340 [Vicinamibacterales bacterium]
MSQPADWGVCFQELATDAGQLYARSLRRYNELLDRVARGELTPEAVQQQFRDYLQEQAPHSTRELLELSVGLLAGLLHVEACYRDALLDGLVPPADPPPPPPSPERLDLTNWFQALATYAAEQSARSIARHQQLVERVASGAIAPDQVKSQGERFLDSHAPAFLGDVMTLGLTFVSRLQKSSVTLSDGLYDRVLGPQTAERFPLEPPVCLDLRAASGAAAIATIVVENTRAAAADVVCHVSHFMPRSGGERFEPTMTIEPGRFRLLPGEAHDVDIAVTLDPVRFAVGTDYVATLLVSGAGERDLVIQLIARADVPIATMQAAPAADKSDAVGVRRGGSRRGVRKS